MGVKNFMILSSHSQGVQSAIKVSKQVKKFIPPPTAKNVAAYSENLISYNDFLTFLIEIEFFFEFMKLRYVA